MQILRHFGENFNVKECSKQTASCDNCESGRGSRFQFKDYSEEAKLIVSSIQLIYKNANKKFPISHYVDVFKGNKIVPFYELLLLILFCSQRFTKRKSEGRKSSIAADAW